MFEQSILLDHTGVKKTGALAASLTMQTIAVGMLILIPLFYHDHLPDVHPYISLSLPLPPPPLAPAPVERAASSPRPSHASAEPTRTFHAPRRIVSLDEIPQITALEAPAAYGSADAIGIPGGIEGGVPSSTGILRDIPLPKPRPAPVESPKTPAKPVSVSGGVQAAKLVKQVIPVYPALARQMRVSGTVHLIGVIAKDGTIQQLQLVNGHSLLVQAALDAVRQWIYKPTLLSGQPVEVIAPIDVVFTLGQ